jgi:hypothetical protein
VYVKYGICIVSIICVCTLYVNKYIFLYALWYMYISVCMHMNGISVIDIFLCEYGYIEYVRTSCSKSGKIFEKSGDRKFD